MLLLLEFKSTLSVRSVHVVAKCSFALVVDVEWFCKASNSIPYRASQCVIYLTISDGTVCVLTVLIMI